jgi:hypothetical protein
MNLPRSPLSPLLACTVLLVTGCGLIPGLPSVTTNGSVAVTYDGKPLPVNSGRVICTFDGKGSVAFLSGDEKTGDTFAGAYSTDGSHSFIVKTPAFQMGLVATNSDGGKDLTKASVDKRTYTFEGVASDIAGAVAANGKETKKPIKVIVTCS